MEVKSNINSYIRYAIIGIIIVLILMLIHTCNNNSNLKVALNMSEQNTKALTDSVRINKNKVGGIDFSKNIMVTEKSGLKDLSKDLKAELDKEKGKVSELTKSIISIKAGKVQYIPTIVEVYPDSTEGLKWEYKKIYDKNNSRFIVGVSKFKIDSLGNVIALNTELTTDEINFNVVQGLREKDGNIEMFVRSDYLGFKVSELNSVIINPQTHPILKKFVKNRRFGLGPYIGYGVYLNNFNGEVGLGVQIGVGLHYDILKF